MEFRPLTAADMEAFGRLTAFPWGDGQWDRCWCAISHYRTIKPEEWDRLCSGDGAENRAQIAGCLDRGFSPGTLAVDDDGTLLAWCSWGPATEFPLFHQRAEQLGEHASRTAIIVCNTTSADHKRQGLMRALTAEVIRQAREAGFVAIEAFPFPEDILAGPTGPGHSWMGYPSLYRAFGFVALDVQSPARRGDHDRPVYRLEL
ncbi:MAG: GNAT family N-acetyltransferase [bacterium]